MAYNKKIDEANIIFKKIEFNFPEYLPEAKYFSAIYNVKKRDTPTLLDSVENILNEAKNGFIERLKLYAPNIGISDLYRIPDDEGMFYNDDFQQQQQQCEYLILSIIQSCDEFLGKFVEPSDFICDTLKEEASMLVYENLSNYENPPIIEYKVCKSFDEEKLDYYCQENGANLKIVKENLKKGSNISEELLRGIFEIKSYQDFWEALKAGYLLNDIRNESFIDIMKLSPITEEIIRYCITDNYDFGSQLIQYPVVRQWKRLSNTRDIQKSLMECFERNNIVKTTQFGTLLKSDAAKHFLSPSLTVEEICNFGISPENVVDLIPILVNNDIFSKT
uniref:Uncharacterized protein n=1 Tax=Panagrolaimus superbus TaxID=310955 RepID=A0A914XTN5_9BILA